jgi:hypothetical protein
LDWGCHCCLFFSRLRPLWISFREVHTIRKGKKEGLYVLGMRGTGRLEVGRMVIGIYSQLFFISTKST